MKYGSLILEKKEYVIIKSLLNLSKYYKDSVQKSSLDKLRNELETAIISDDEDVPNDIIRLNSTVTVSSDDNWSYTFQVVLPTDNNTLEKKISILTPMGAAVIGYSKDDIILWEFRNGIKAITIVSVEQSNNLINLNHS